MQRASLCRALIHDPKLLLLDEPFGALDQFTREELWAILQELWIDAKPTVMLVTHDLREAGYLANRIVVMRARPGRIMDDSRSLRAAALDGHDLRPGFRQPDAAAAQADRRVRGDNVPQTRRQEAAA